MIVNLLAFGVFNQLPKVQIKCRAALAERFSSKFQPARLDSIMQAV